MSLFPSTERTLLARVARAQCDGRCPSLVAGVVREGKLVWHTGRGAVEEPADDVQYRLGSISKTVCAITVLRLRDEGLLDLSDTLEQHLPGTPLGDRTLTQLLSHTGGVTSESPGLWWERTPAQELPLSAADRVLPAGRRFHYSNLGFGLLGELVARARGRSWDVVATDEVLRPLGMTRTTPRPEGRAAQGYAVHPWSDEVLPEPEHHAGIMAPAGQLWATARDLARLGAFLLGDGGGVLSPDTVEEMTLPAGVDFSGAWGSYGLGVQVQQKDGRTLVGHGGSMPGFLAGLWCDREEGTAALALANVTSGLDGALPATLLADLREAEPTIVAEWSPSPSPVPASLLGPWYWGPSPYVLRAVPGGLLHLGGLGRPGRSSRFRAREDGTWVGLDGYFAGETLRLDPVALNLATFVFTRTPYDPAAPVPGGVDAGGWQVP
ncbi:serine hydrolase domain-containing protein [Pseudonocardia ailaonensis]|uniref:Serine hydrolase domain-containing protein n=1 Tax=Pseudonocardia ailaonensis TaxID=367279 RepID=A0ABN2N253_9PSEU